MNMNTIDYIAWVLVVVGGLNWGLVGALDYNLVDSLFGVDSMVATTVYVLVGLAAVYSIVALVAKLGKSGSNA